MVFNSFCQVIDDFDDGDLSVNPSWIGDLNNFISNAEGVLRLNAQAAGKTFISTSNTMPDSFNLKIELGLEFSPSASNLVKIYLFLDDLNVSVANGYYLNFGENGNEDAIKLFKLSKGVPILLASGTSGAIAKNLNQISLELTYNSRKEWKLRSAFDGQALLKQEFLITEPWTFKNFGFFAIECEYTSTRKDKVYFDNLILEKLTSDITPPSLISTKILSESKIELEFSEEIILPQKENFKINPELTILSVTQDPFNSHKLILTLDKRLDEGKTYILMVSNIRDIANNASLERSTAIGLYKSPNRNEVIITEILFDPISGGADYIEFYNSSDKVVNLKSSKIGNISRNQSISITNDILLNPKNFVCFTSDPNWVKNEYNPPTNSTIIQQTLPLYNATDGIASIQNENGIVIDSFSYTDELHNKILNNVKGVSLERVSIVDGTFTNIWTSGIQSTNFGTPGYLNANKNNGVINTEDMFSLLSKSFSPNGDGEKDELIFVYKLPKSGFITEINVYAEDGHLINTISKGEFIASQGFFKWDGFNANDELERIGVYILVGKFFHVDGETYQIYQPCILSDK